MGCLAYQLKMQDLFNQQYYVKNIYMIVCVCNHLVYILQLFQCNFTRQSGHFEPLGLLFFWVDPFPTAYSDFEISRTWQ